MQGAIDLLIRTLIQLLGEKFTIYLINQCRLWYFTRLTAEMQAKADADYDIKFAEWQAYKDDRES